MSIKGVIAAFIISLALLSSQAGSCLADTITQTVTLKGAYQHLYSNLDGIDINEVVSRADGSFHKFNRDGEKLTAVDFKIHGNGSFVTYFRNTSRTSGQVAEYASVSTNLHSTDSIVDAIFHEFGSVDVATVPDPSDPSSDVPAHGSLAIIEGMVGLDIDVSLVKSELLLSFIGPGDINFFTTAAGRIDISATANIREMQLVTVADLVIDVVYRYGSDSPATVPEPSSFFLGTMGVIGVAFAMRRLKRR